MRYPQRIVCLTTEPTEVLYMLGEQNRIVGISGFTTRPTIARREKPKVSAFTSANIDKIINLKPDLVIGFSDLQAEVAASLIRAGIEVHVFNQRSIDQVLNMIATLGSLVGASDKASKLIANLENTISQAREAANYLSQKPKVYFEEWDEPIMCGIRWAIELIEIAGGVDCFPELSYLHSAKDRAIQASQVIERQPDIIIGSWCGKKFQPIKVISREGWNNIPAVKNGFVREIKSVDILQPGPSLITHGLTQVQSIIQEWDSFKAQKNSYHE